MMSKIKKLKTKLSISIGIIVLMVIMVVGVVATEAYYGTGSEKIVNEAGVIFNYNEAQPLAETVGQTQLGAYDESFTNFTKLKATEAFISEGSASVVTFTQGGGVLATSTIAAVVPLTASDFDTENMIDVTLNVQNATLSFPATTTLTSFIPNTGDTRRLFIRNATTTASMNITVAGGTGVLLKVATTSPSAVTTTSKIITGDTDGANFAIIDLIRKANTDIEALLQIFKD